MRLFVVAFLALATAISINAIYLQDAPRFAGTAMRVLAPERESRSTSATASLPTQQASARTSVAVAEKHNELEAFRAGATQPSQPVRSVSELVRAIQRELGGRGYAAGPETGHLDMATRAAIVAYEFDENMPLTGEPSEAVLKSLIFGQAAGKAGPGPVGRFERRRELVAEVQNMLARLGYSSGPVDGRLDARTREAIRKFAADRNLSGAGQLNERVLLEMVIVSGKALNANG